MRSHTSFFDTSYPKREIRVVDDEVDPTGKGKKKIQIFENGARVREIKDLHVDLKSYIAGIFEGYRCTEY